MAMGSEGCVIDVYLSGLGDGWWVATYARWECCRACPIEAVAAVMEFEAESENTKENP